MLPGRRSVVRAIRAYLFLLAIVAVPLGVLAAVHFPRQVDEVHAYTPPKVSKDYYKSIYAADSSAAVVEADDSESKYVVMAREAIKRDRIVEHVSEFAAQYGLANKRVLDVGAGTGYLQDVVEDYVGLDISASARRYFHKPFVEASATEMPFPDNEFDAAWSIWVLEHVPKPEQALVEIRRVMRDGGVLYLRPAWKCAWWFGEGYEVRPYSDFGLGGKLKKASLSVLATPLYRALSYIPPRFVRSAQAAVSKQPTQLHYNLLEPNYDDYWVPDSDALNGIDYYETLLWFTSRGDECLNCESTAIIDSKELIIRIHKSGPAVARAALQ